MKNYYKNSWIILALILAVGGCSKKPTDYRSFLGGQEIKYPGLPQTYFLKTGNLRLMLEWIPSPDPSITKYVVYWNNKADSTVIDVSHSIPDTVKCMISPLSETLYSFNVYSVDNSGNRSVPVTLYNIPVYGPNYQSGLHNRLPDPSKVPVLSPDGSVTLNFQAPIDSINVTTLIKYVNGLGDTAVTQLAPTANSLTLSSWKAGSRIVYQSSYIPVRYTLDTFKTMGFDTIPFVYVMCDKSLFNAMTLPNDMGVYSSTDTYMARLWDGNMQPRAYPTIYHNDGNQNLPANLSFDMGKVYKNLAKVEETGRSCCHNPVDFEIWGIADTTGAVSQLAGSDPNWTADVKAKGWTLLKEVIRSDDGINPLDANLISNPPPVRFMIMRVIKTWDDPKYVNMSQITFWDRQ